MLRYEFRQRTIDTFAEAGQREPILECKWLPHLNNHVISCNQQDSIKSSAYPLHTGNSDKTCRKEVLLHMYLLRFCCKESQLQLQLSIRQLFFLRLILSYYGHVHDVKRPKSVLINRVFVRQTHARIKINIRFQPLTVRLL